MYQGGKSRQAKRIAALINRVAGDIYIEPFVGAANVIARVNKRIRVGADLHEDLVMMWRMWQAATDQLVFVPLTIDEQTYKSFKHNDPSGLRGLIGFGASWGGKWFGGFARGEGRDFYNEAVRSTMKLSESMADVFWVHADYRELSYPRGAVVYFDPPYEDVTAYSHLPQFDHDEFWQFATDLSVHSKVLVSERFAPAGWERVLTFEAGGYSPTGQGSNHKYTDGLFVYRGN